MADQIQSPVQPAYSAEELWGLPLQVAGCLKCKQAFLVEASKIGQVCPNCAQGRLDPQPALLRKEPPELFVPFQVERNRLLPIFSAFTKPVWLHPDDFSAERLLQRAVPVFWPMWLVDSDLEGDWQAEAGYDYQVKSSQESYSGSGWQTRERIETRIRWEPRLGQLRRHYNNMAAPALSEQKRMLELTGSYNLQVAQNYQPEQLKALVQGGALQVPDLNPQSAWPVAQEKLNNAAGDECRQAAGAQHIRNFRIRTRYENLCWTQLLLPLYTSYYLDDEGKPHTVVINAQNGKIGGRRLASQKKGWLYAGIVAGAGLLLFLFGILLTALTFVFPPASILGVILIVIGLLVALGAIIPAAWPWQWNRKQQ